MKLVLINTIILTLLGCQPKYTSIFDKDCSCDPIRFDEGITVHDSLREYSLKTFESWSPIRNLEQGHSFLIFGDSVKGSLSSIATDLQSYNSDWVWTQEVQSIMEYWDVLNHGQIEHDGNTLYWIDVEEFHPYLRSRYIVQVKTEIEKMLSVTLMTSDSLDPAVRICEMERIIDTIDIIR